MIRRSILTAVCVCFLMLAWPLDATAAPAAAEPVAVLDAHSVWRMHQTLKPPVARVDGALKPLVLNLPWVDRETAAPPSDWTQPGYDDH